MENQANATDSRKAALSPRQTLSLPYIAATASLTAGARAARIHRATLHRWMTDSNFRAELERLRQDAEALARVELQGLVLKSISTLAELLEDSNPTVRGAAVRSALSNALKIGENRDLRRQLELIENAQAMARQQR